MHLMKRVMYSKNNLWNSSTNRVWSIFLYLEFFGMFLFAGSIDHICLKIKTSRSYQSCVWNNEINKLWKHKSTVSGWELLTQSIKIYFLSFILLSGILSVMFIPYTPLHWREQEDNIVVSSFKDEYLMIEIRITITIACVENKR